VKILQYSKQFQANLTLRRHVRKLHEGVVLPEVRDVAKDVRQANLTLDVGHSISTDIRIFRDLLLKQKTSGRDDIFIFFSEYLFGPTPSNSTAVLQC